MWALNRFTFVSCDVARIQVSLVLITQTLKSGRTEGDISCELE